MSLSRGPRAYQSWRLLLAPSRCQAARAAAKPISQTRQSSTKLHNAKLVMRRIEDLGGMEKLAGHYPRVQIPMGGEVLAADVVQDKLLQHGLNSKTKTSDDSVKYNTYGRLVNKRKLSSQMSFWVLQGQGHQTLQILVRTDDILYSRPEADHDATKAEVAAVRTKARVGDWIAVEGHPYLTPSGEPTLKVTSVPQILSPALQPIPESLDDPEVRSRQRHVERIIDSSARDTIILRHKVISALRSFLTDKDFIEVNTPLLDGEAGGAAARPFVTQATELRDAKLYLRVAPELYLKRLVVGNIQRVFEIGPAFRNEGVDHTHNPEFTICEFYQAMANLDSLMRMTEDLFEHLTETVNTARRTLPSIPRPDDMLEFSWQTIDFIPALEAAIQAQLPDYYLPDLQSPDALDNLQSLFTKLSLLLPAKTDLANLLDELASHYLEPQASSRPTWIIHHPECMSPLAKTFASSTASKSGIVHRIAARAELFINGREYVNCYEEENSPTEQRRKLLSQLEQRDDKAAYIDESYVQALEFGLPPTGGWGCGVDRLVMLFAGKHRIADVLPFGTVTNVYALNADQRIEAGKNKGNLK